jgi:hypothetical protein
MKSSRVWVYPFEGTDQEISDVTNLEMVPMMLAAASLTAAHPKGFEAGWNGLAATPPLAWRTCNAQFLGMPWTSK